MHIRFNGFFIHDSRVKINDTLMFLLINNETGTTKTFKFSLKEATLIRKSYHIDIQNYNLHTFSIILSKQTGIFQKQQIGRCDIPTFMFPVDTVSYNNLYMNTGNYNNPQIVMKCIIAVVENSRPYHGKLVRSVLPQAEVDDLSFSINDNIEINNQECPLLL